MNIRAVLFDLDDTLTDDHSSLQESIAATSEALANQCTGLDAHDLAAAYWRESDSVWTVFQMEQQDGRPREDGTGDRLRRESWRRALCACGLADERLVEGAANEYLRWRRVTLRLAPGANEVLEALKETKRTAIVTNGAAEIQRWKLRQLGLETRVDYSIVAEEFGFGKPNPSIFLHVAEELRVPPADCIMVGDILAFDIAGAKAAGMHSIWINRNSHKASEGDPSPDFVIQDLREVLDILRNVRTKK